MPSEPSSKNCSDGIRPAPGLPTGPTEAEIAKPGESSEKPASPRRIRAAQRFAVLRMRSTFEGCRGKGRPGVAVGDERAPQRTIRGTGGVLEWAAQGETAGSLGRRPMGQAGLERLSLGIGPGCAAAVAPCWGLGSGPSGPARRVLGDLDR